MPRNGAVGFTEDRAHASTGDDGFTRVASHTGGRQLGLAAVPVRADRTSASPTAPQVPPMWRVRIAWPRCRWVVGGQSGLRDTGQDAVPVGGGGAWPGFAATRRAKLAAQTARGRAAAHRHTQRPGPTTRPSRRPEHQRHQSTQQQAPHERAQAYKKPTSAIGCRSVVELGGFEPPTFSLRTRRATNCAIAPRTHTA